MKTCETCRFWGLPSKKIFSDGTTLERWDKGCLWSHGPEWNVCGALPIYGTDDPKAIAAIVASDEDDYALITKGLFGCVLHEDKP